jgi:hypothetical protein
MPPPIPQELSDMILDFLHNDVSALCNAGLVCKSWLPASRFHLFSKLEIHLCAPVYPRILELICAEGSTIPPYILRLRIAVDLGYVDEIQSVNETILRIPLLSNLKSLSLSRIEMTRLTPDAKKNLTTMLRNLTFLKLSYFIVRNCFSPYLD